jgi:hypothetical protein
MTFNACACLIVTPLFHPSAQLNIGSNTTAAVRETKNKPFFYAIPKELAGFR